MEFKNLMGKGKLMQDKISVALKTKKHKTRMCKYKLSSEKDK